MTPRLARVLLAVFGLALALAILEGGARWLEARRDPGAVRVDDPRLEYRVAPGTGGHDARGNRNREAPRAVDVVALGDSQTWGVNASIDETWPARLAAQTGLRVYNMGHGGYGPLQYAALVPEALELAPRFLFVAVYFGNDVFDAYDLAYRFEAHADRRHPDPEERARIAAAPYPDLKRMFFQRVSYRRPGRAPLDWLRTHTAAGRLAAAGGFAPVSGADRAWAEDHPDEGFVYADGTLLTVFHTTYRLAAVDTRLPRVREGLRITESALLELARAVAAAPGTELLVLLLPTKERIFARAVDKAERAERAERAEKDESRGTRAPPSYRESVEFEARIAARLAAFMDANGIRWVDALPELRARVGRGEALFPRNGDGHFTPAGYAAVAGVAASALRAEPPAR